jgi:predicted DNA binding CopG/RHH family protein
MNKKVTMGPKPQPKQTLIENADAWVNAEVPVTKTVPTEEKMKRLTLDVNENLHRRIKAQCAMKGVNMADELRGILEAYFPSNGD